MFLYLILVAKKKVNSIIEENSNFSKSSIFVSCNKTDNDFCVEFNRWEVIVI